MVRSDLVNFCNKFGLSVRAIIPYALFAFVCSSARDFVRACSLGVCSVVFDTGAKFTSRRSPSGPL